MNRIQNRWTLCVALLAATLVCVATLAHADLPKALEKVDRAAPCFRWPAVDYDGDGVYDRIDRCPDTPKGCVVDMYGCSIDSDGDGVCDGLDKCENTAKGDSVDVNGCSATQRAAMRESKTATTMPPAEAPKTVTPTPPPAPKPSEPANEVERQLIAGGKVRLENIYFETNKATLLPESERTLNEAGDALEKFAYLRIEVQGHTDTRGSALHNMKLSQARAESVRQYLLDHFHLKPENLVAKGYGKTQPETKERNDEERLRNRRVVLRVLNPEALPNNVKIEKH